MNLNNLASIPDKQGRRFSGYLACLETGRVYSLKTNKWLKPTPSKDGYLKLSLMDDDKKLYSTFAHRAVLAAKIQSWDYFECDHKDGNNQNNCADNLRPVNDRQSQYDARVRMLISIANTGEKHGRSRFTNAEVRQMLIDYSGHDNKPNFITEKAKTIGCTRTAIYLICTRRTWKHIEIDSHELTHKQ